MAIDFAADLDLAMQGNEHPLTAITWAQVQTAGTASKAIAKAWRTTKGRAGPAEEVNLGEDLAEFVVPADQFTSGFAGGSAASVVPSDKDTITVSGEGVWQVASVELMAAGAWWLAKCVRRRAGVAA